MDEDNMVRWNFEPFVPVPSDDTRRTMFLRRWQKMMGGKEQEHEVWSLENEAERHPIISLFEPYYPTPHQVRVATSLVAWLGCNVGRGFLEGDCERMKEAFNVSQPNDLGTYGSQQAYRGSRAYLAAWACECNPMNGGGLHVPRVILNGHEPTVDDLKTMERVMVWLGGKQGQDFLQGCEAENLKREQRLRQQRYKKLGWKMPSRL